MKLMIEVAIGATVWGAASLTFFHIWCRRSGKYWTRDTAINPDKEKHHYFKYLPEDGWYVSGWSSENHEWYSLRDAMFVSLLCWLPVLVIIGVRELGKAIGRGGKMGFEYALPKPMREEPPMLVRASSQNDAFMLAAFSEVDRIAPNHD